MEPLGAAPAAGMSKIGVTTPKYVKVESNQVVSSLAQLHSWIRPCGLDICNRAPFLVLPIWKPRMLLYFLSGNIGCSVLPFWKYWMLLYVYSGNLGCSRESVAATIFMNRQPFGLQISLSSFYCPFVPGARALLMCWELRECGPEWQSIRFGVIQVQQLPRLVGCLSSCDSLHSAARFVSKLLLVFAGLVLW
jgi:hypothetical protein